jgi:uncharacterized protein with von Willebrand factor type A (vWA) domain
MVIYRYSEWDGTQDLFDLDAGKLMDELERHLLSYGDLSYALRLLQHGGIRDSQGRRLPSLQELLNRLRQQRQQQLDKYDLSSILDDIRHRLDDIVNTERQGIERRLEETRQRANDTSSELSSEMLEKLLKSVEDRATQNLQKLEKLPSDVGGRIKELSQYDFMDDDAKRQFQELLDMLKRNAIQPHARDLMRQIESMDPSTLAEIRRLVKAINRMLEERLRGEEPDFQDFLREFGHFFGPQPPQSLDELIQQLQNQMAQAQSLLDSLSPEDKKTLEDLLDSMLDDATRFELAKLAAGLEALNPARHLPRPYLFSGNESISYTEALKLMEMLHKIDRLEAQIQEAQFGGSLDNVDEKLVTELAGEQVAKELEQLRSITKILEEAGYIQWTDDRYELTPHGMRRIGQKALKDIFAHLKKDSLGRHNLKLKGPGGEKMDETKKYEFGDEFQIHLQKTIMNSLLRQPQTPPLHISPDDFEVFRTEMLTKSATVLMMDLSLSMPLRGNFQAAKRVAIALDSLIKTQYPRDILDIIGFSTYARVIKREELAYITWDEFDPYTNMQQALSMARGLLSKTRCNNKQIILITDGEPTAHIENGHLFLQFPPTLRTLQLTLREAKRCTERGIIINTFMLDTHQLSSTFVTQMAKANKGRVFFTTGDNLGQYLLVDYLDNKRRRI